MFDWEAKLRDNLVSTISTIPADSLARVINDTIATTAPASAFRRIYGAPFAPPLESLTAATLAKVVTAPNPAVPRDAAQPDRRRSLPTCIGSVDQPAASTSSRVLPSRICR